MLTLRSVVRSPFLGNGKCGIQNVGFKIQNVPVDVLSSLPNRMLADIHNSPGLVSVPLHVNFVMNIRKKSILTPSTL